MTSTIKARLGAVLAVVAVVAASAVATAGSAFADHDRHDGDGHGHAAYAVGSRSVVFVDTTRPTPANGTYPGAPSRTLSTLILYPARGDASGPIVPGATPARTGRGFPLVVLSHGFTGTGPAFAPVGAQFARAGYVVALPTFPLSNGAAPGGPAAGDYVNQPGDVSFVITQMLRLDRTKGDALRNALDDDEIGVAGHSLGAVTTLGVAANTCCQDRRIDAAVSFSGIELFPNGKWFAQPTPPLLLVHGTADGTVPYVASVNVYGQAPAPKAFLTLAGAPHSLFRAPWLDPTVKTVVDFLDGYLKHDRVALRRLARDGNVPGVASLQEDLCARSWGRCRPAA
jgi:dienelactone hydrolase